MESYYVVVFDHRTGEFRLDDEALIARFPDGCLYDEVLGEQRQLQDVDVEFRDADWDAQIKLRDVLSDVKLKGWGF